jgi:hypothetical protein
MSVQAIARVMAESDATATTRLVLLVMANRAGGDDDVCFASVERISDECRMSERAVQSNLRLLEASGDIVLQGVHPEYRTNVYRVMPVGVQILHPGADVRRTSAPNRKKQGSDLGLVSSSSEVGSLSVSDSFDAFWSVYPRKVSKAGAKRKFAALVRSGVPPGVLIEGATRLRDDPNRTDEYTKHPTTWLTNGCWDDAPLPAPGGQRKDNTVTRALALADQMEAAT